jgi:hypothetical protein
VNNANAGSRPGPVDWFSVSGPDRLAAWQGLAEFVEALVFRYNMQLEIRPCWWAHGAAIEELTALWHMRQALYGPDADLKNAMQWQDTLQRSRDRLRPIFRSCRDDHVRSAVNFWMSDQARKAFVDAVRSDLLGDASTAGAGGTSRPGP